MKRNSRKRGPEVWQFRWSEIGPDGKRHHHKKILGTVEQYPDENAARRAVVGLVSEINAGTRPMNPSAMTVGQLCGHFEQRELTKDNSWRGHATKKIYQAYLRSLYNTSDQLRLSLATQIYGLENRCDLELFADCARARHVRFRHSYDFAMSSYILRNRLRIIGG